MQDSSTAPVPTPGRTPTPAETRRWIVQHAGANRHTRRASRVIARRELVTKRLASGWNRGAWSHQAAV